MPYTSLTSIVDRIHRSGVAALAVAGAMTIAGALAVLFTASEAAAQATTNCGDIQKMLIQRQGITARLTSASKGKKIEAKVACSNFGQLVSNGQTLLKWVDANKDWCQIPDSFTQGIRADHGRAITIRAQACNVAAKQATMEKQARDGGGGGSGGLLGGGGLEGSSAMPKGAL